MLIHRHQGSKNVKSEAEMSRIQSSVRYLSRSFYFRSRFKRWISTRYGFLFITALFVIFLNEVLFYQWARFHWPEIDSLAQK